MQQENETLYSILGVRPNATRDEIIAAFRHLAAKCHPDTKQGEAEKRVAEEQFKRINEAKRVLSDPQMRQQYDVYLNQVAATDNWNVSDVSVGTPGFFIRLTPEECDAIFAWLFDL